MTKKRENWKLELVASTPSSRRWELIPKGLRWSPDGTCLLSATGRELEVYEVPEAILLNEQTKKTTTWKPVLRCQENDVYDYAWYPGQDSREPLTCCFLSTSRDQPLHLWDAYSGALRASYVAWSDADQIQTAVSCGFSPDGTKVFAGAQDRIFIFDTSVPGSDCDMFVTKKSGLIGALASTQNVYAAGFYAGSIAVYDDRSATLVARIAELPGITKLMFRSEHILFAGARAEKNGCVRSWDLRATTQEPLHRYPRSCQTNQRLGFDVGLDRLATADDQHGALIYDLNSTLRSSVLPRPRDVVNDVAFHPFRPLLALALGQRRFPDNPDHHPRSAILLFSEETSIETIPSSAEVVSTGN